MPRFFASGMRDPGVLRNAAVVIVHSARALIKDHLGRQVEFGRQVECWCQDLPSSQVWKPLHSKNGVTSWELQSAKIDAVLWAKVWQLGKNPSPGSALPGTWCPERRSNMPANGPERWRLVQPWASCIAKACFGDMWPSRNAKPAGVSRVLHVSRSWPNRRVVCKSQVGKAAGPASLPRCVLQQCSKALARARQVASIRGRISMFRLRAC